MSRWNAPLCCSGLGVSLQSHSRNVHVPAAASPKLQVGPVKIHQMAAEWVSGTLEGKGDVSCALVRVKDLREELDCCGYVCVAGVTEAGER
ncbi:hypothetical protein CSUI_009024 [Cystoisospora suis]|uniref:Uncharacterized protein n=1 Tax=Cystoisospora suis TaxID=483139 RepID=A0A2C6KKZ2_9APIC|nr:hypothetical protein CSUI_009024 [Cystoisospora suis]